MNRPILTLSALGAAALAILFAGLPARAGQAGQTAHLPIILKARILTGTVQGQVVDATGGANLPPPIPGAQVCHASESLCATTDTDGLYSLSQVPVLTQTLQVTAAGFSALEHPVRVTNNQTTTLNFALSPPLSSGEFQIVLIWGDLPMDLDAHLWLPAAIPEHIQWINPGDCDVGPFYACLITDRRQGFGPETITISQRFSGTYVYAVNLYEGTLPLAQSNAAVQVYDETGLVAAFAVPADGEGLWWHVFDLDGTTGEVIPRDDLSDLSPGPYHPGYH